MNKIRTTKSAVTLKVRVDEGDMGVAEVNLSAATNQPIATLAQGDIVMTLEDVQNLLDAMKSLVKA